MRTRNTTGLLALVALFAWRAPPASAESNPDAIIPTANYSHGCYNSATLAGTPCKTDNAEAWTWEDPSIYAALSTYIGRAVSEDNATDLNFHYDYTPVFSGRGETDIVYESKLIDTAIILGSTWCNDAVDGTTWSCDQQYVRFNTVAQARAYGGDITQVVTCHETGHAVGVVHGDNAYPTVNTSSESLFGCDVSDGYWHPNALHVASRIVAGINANY